MCLEFFETLPCIQPSRGVFQPSSIFCRSYLKLVYFAHKHTHTEEAYVTHVHLNVLMYSKVHVRRSSSWCICRFR